jgi:hypothetical protein
LYASAKVSLQSRGYAWSVSVADKKYGKRVATTGSPILRLLIPDFSGGPDWSNSCNDPSTDPGVNPGGFPPGSGDNPGPFPK